jgi:hypothetical protein
MSVPDQPFSATQVPEGEERGDAAEHQQQDRRHECDLCLSRRHRLACKSNKRSRTSGRRPDLPCKTEHQSRTLSILQRSWMKSKNIWCWKSLPRTGPFGDDDCGNAAAWTEFALHLSPNRLGPSHHIFEDAVHDVFLKNADVAVGL